MKMLLPLGSIVLVGETQYMIIGYLPNKKDNQNEIYDYVAVNYPFGYQNESMTFLNKEDITALMFIGFQNRQSNEFRKICTEVKENLQDGKSLEFAIKLATKQIEELGE